MATLGINRTMFLLSRCRTIASSFFRYQKRMKFYRLGLVGTALVTGMAAPTALGKSFADPNTAMREGCNQLSSTAPVIHEADKLLENDRFAQAYNLLYPFKDSNNEEILWRLAKTTHELSKQTQNSARVKQMNADAFSYISRALEINNSHGEIHKWMAILMDAYYKEIGIKARLAHVVQVKQHMIAAAEINPADPLPWYMLGWWCFSLADMPWAHRQIATLIYGSVPQASFEEALNFFQKAENVDQNFKGMNLVMIGKTYLKLGQEENAKIYFRKAVHFKVLTEEDKQAQDEAQTQLAKMGIS